MRRMAMIRAHDIHLTNQIKISIGCRVSGRILALPKIYFIKL